MPKVELIATRNFTYSTRRLKAGDPFSARNRDDAKILVELLGKATYGRPVGSVSPPPPEVAERARAATQPSAPTPIPTIKQVLEAKVIKAKPQLDHDGNGKAGGSKKGSTRRNRKTKK